MHNIYDLLFGYILICGIDVLNVANHKACVYFYAEHHDHHSHDHTHDPGVSSVSIVCEGSLDLEKVGFTCGLFIYHDTPKFFENTIDL